MTNIRLLDALCWDTGPRGDILGLGNLSLKPGNYALQDSLTIPHPRYIITQPQNYVGKGSDFLPLVQLPFKRIQGFIRQFFHLPSAGTRSRRSRNTNICYLSCILYTASLLCIVYHCWPRQSEEAKLHKSEALGRAGLGCVS